MSGPSCTNMSKTPRRCETSDSNMLNNPLPAVVSLERWRFMKPRPNVGDSECMLAVEQSVIKFIFPGHKAE